LELHSAKHYIQAIRSELPPQVLRRVPSRLWWLPLHLAIISAGWWVVVALQVHWSIKLAWVVVIGHSYACLSFLGHELLHDSVIRRGRLQSVLGWICFLHYAIGPDHWRRWHNHEHHHKTSHPGLDPDSFGNLAVYRRSRVHRAIEPFGPGSGCLRSLAYFSYFFSFQSLAVLFYHSKRLKFWTPRDRLKVWAQWWAAVLFWAAVAATVGPANFVFIYVLPLGVANAIQMAYIATNHFLSPETRETNDPLVNSLTVTVGPLARLFHMNFNYHVEHHVLPSMNPCYAPLVHDLLVRKFPDRYREMPHWRAIFWLYRTPRVHWDATHLVNPRDGVLYDTIEPNRPPQLAGRLPLPVPLPRRELPDDHGDIAEVASAPRASSSP
jgi:fatty acid desaturase